MIDPYLTPEKYKTLNYFTYFTKLIVVLVYIASEFKLISISLKKLSSSPTYYKIPKILKKTEKF